MIIGAFAFSMNPYHIEFIAIHPQYRNCGIQKLFIETLQDLYCPNEDISITTFRKKILPIQDIERSWSSLVLSKMIF